MKAVLVAGLFLFSEISCRTCYWDSDCAQTDDCCINEKCRSQSTCQTVRYDYPRNNFQTCVANSDCISGCCHAQYCTMLDACNEDALSAGSPLFVSLILLGLLTFILGIFYAKDTFKRRMRRRQLQAPSHFNKNTEHLTERLSNRTIEESEDAGRSSFAESLVDNDFS